jgi:hypothetical protein
MPDPSSPADFLLDPLSEISRKERRNLLISSMLGIIVAEIDLVPKKMSALGIEFSVSSQKSFVVLIMIVICYFIISFIFYGLTDFVIFRKKYQDHLLKAEVESQNWTEEDQRDQDERHATMAIPNTEWFYVWSPRLVKVRAVVEFIIPVLIGIASIITLCVSRGIF